MEGEYRKYNCNSGFVDEQLHNSPQAFNQFTFERSGHQFLVVDLQGVGDLYTEPQIHTADRVGYSNGNFSPRGMAFFLHSHHCNPLCEWLGLTAFDLAPSELGTNTPLYPQPSVHTRTDEDGEEPSVSKASISPKDENSKLKKIHVDGKLSEVAKTSSKSHPNGDETASIGAYTKLKLDTLAPVLLDPNFSESSDSARPYFSFTPPLVTCSGQTQFPRPVLALDPFPVHIISRSRDQATSGDLGNSCRINLLSCSTTTGATSGVAASTVTGILALSDMAYSPSVTPAAIPISPPRLTLTFDFSTASTQVHSGLAGGSVSLLVDYCTPESPIGPPAMFQHQFNMPTNSYSMLNTRWDEMANNWASVGHWDHGWPLASGVRVAPVVPRLRLNLSESSGLLLKNHNLDDSEDEAVHHCPENPTNCARLSPNGGGDDGSSVVRFSGQSIEWAALLFHELHAAQLNCPDAMIFMAHHYLGLPTQLMLDCPIKPNQRDLRSGVDYLGRAAEGGDRRCMSFLARFLDFSASLSDSAYAKAVDTAGATSPGDGAPEEGLDAKGRYDAAEDFVPVHRILTRMAEMYSIGGFDLKLNLNMAGDLFTQAYELASAARQGRLTAKYFKFGEDAYSNCERTAPVPPSLPHTVTVITYTEDQ
ncbi:Eukaryotic elongation factor 2 kinase [Fasciola hepatica]|uniref:Eukaryotic elongation factor 2 kinase n=1 Tax=Fasciola hepatica TaxID=6192 RepID=A0A4E0R4P8_FASHE|nr:Eukaryotic elongation factor 2 kinase [Fasciola hepatica]